MDLTRRGPLWWRLFWWNRAVEKRERLARVEREYTRAWTQDYIDRGRRLFDEDR
jgi:hypothetical protein